MVMLDKLNTALLLLAFTACSQAGDIDWQTATVRSFTIEVPVEGTLDAKHAQSVFPPAGDQNSFKISQLVAEGSLVKEGDAVVSFDSKDLYSKLQELNSQLATAELTLSQKREELALAKGKQKLEIAKAVAQERRQTLSAAVPEELEGSLNIQLAKLAQQAATAKVEHLRSLQEHRKAKSQGEVDSLHRILREKRQQIAALEKQISDMVVRAKHGGTAIHNRHPWTDEKSKVGDQVWRTISPLAIAALDSMAAQGSVSEAESAKLQVGQAVRLRLEAQPDSTIDGTIASIGTNIQAQSPTVPKKVIHVTMDIVPPKELQLSPGMRFSGNIVVQQIDSAIVIAQRGVYVSPKGPVVYTKRNGEIHRTEVSIGARAADQVQITAGLAPGDVFSLQDLSGEAP